MALLSVAPDISRPTALMLNIFVAIIATIQFYRAGYFDWRTFLSFAVTSVPFAFLGGLIHLPVDWHKKLLGVVLLFTAFRFLWKFAATDEVKQANLWLALVIGALLGFLSGLTGVGGGIFLTPLLLFANWAETKKAAGISAMFILVNSIAGLLGSYAQVQTLPPSVWFWVLAAIVGGIIGSTLGSRYFAIMTLRRILSVVLVIAGVKLIFT
jgi:uncharacterized membrane protein YfcA